MKLTHKARAAKISCKAMIALALAAFILAPTVANAQPTPEIHKNKVGQTQFKAMKKKTQPATPVVTTDSQLLAANETHPPIKLTPDKSEIVELSSAAARIVIGNDAHLNILIDAADRLVLVPRVPGSSFFSVLDANGNIIMQRHAIVASPKQDYIRVRSSCLPSQECADTRVFYCPDICHEINVPTLETADEALVQEDDEASEDN